jgi:hypothetical protein
MMHAFLTTDNVDLHHGEGNVDAKTLATATGRRSRQMPATKMPAIREPS